MFRRISLNRSKRYAKCTIFFPSLFVQEREVEGVNERGDGKKNKKDGQMTVGRKKETRKGRKKLGKKERKKGQRLK